MTRSEATAKAIKAWRELFDHLRERKIEEKLRQIRLMHWELQRKAKGKIELTEVKARWFESRGIVREAWKRFEQEQKKQGQKTYTDYPDIPSRWQDRW